jgi:hypothetical protein
MHRARIIALLNIQHRYSVKTNHYPLECPCPDFFDLWTLKAHCQLKRGEDAAWEGSGHVQWAMDREDQRVHACGVISIREGARAPIDTRGGRH